MHQTSSAKRFPFVVTDKVVYAIDGVSKFILHVVMDLEGPVQPALLTRAIELTLHQAPILRSVARLRMVASYWEAQDGIALQSQLQVVDVSHERQPERAAQSVMESYINDYIDITKTLPLRFLLLQLSAEHWWFVVKVHHALMDPLAITYVIRDIQMFYQRLINGESVPVSPEPLADRGRWPVFKSVPLSLWLRVMRVGWSRLRRHRQEEKKGRRLHVNFAAPAPHADAIAYRTLRWSGPAYLAVRSRAKSLGVTFNDLVIAALLRTVHRWNGVAANPNDFYTVVMPVDMRRYVRSQGHVPKLLSNYVGGTLITMPVGQLTTLEETARYVAQETEFIRQHHVGLRHNLLLPLLMFVPPRWLRRAVQRIHARHPERLAPTAIVAYMGKLERLFKPFAGCQIKGIEGIGAGFYPVGFDLSVFAYGKEYVATLTYRKGACTDQQMDQFTDLFWREVIGEERG